jgi:hypothetical protein
MMAFDVLPAYVAGLLAGEPHESRRPPRPHDRYWLIVASLHVPLLVLPIVASSANLAGPFYSVVRPEWN